MRQTRTIGVVEQGGLSQRDGQGGSLSPVRRPLCVEATDALADGVFAAVSSRVPPGLLELVSDVRAPSGLIVIGPRASATCRKLSRVNPSLPRIVDFARYEDFVASASAPMPWPDAEGMWAWSLDQWVDGIVAAGADVVFSPSGIIRTGDSKALAAVIDSGNGVKRPQLVTTVAVHQAWLTETYLANLQDEIERSERPVGLVVVGKLDPFEELEVAQGLLDLFDSCPGQIFLHRTDNLAAVHAIVQPGLGASIGVTSSLRHTIPQGRRAQARGSVNRQPAVYVFVPGINEFRDIEEVESWFGDRVPCCAMPECCGRRLNDFSRHADDLDILAVHNVRGWLTILEDLVAHESCDRRGWLYRYFQDVESAYIALRAESNVRSIIPCGSAEVWRRLYNRLS